MNPELLDLGRPLEKEVIEIATVSVVEGEGEAVCSWHVASTCTIVTLTPQSSITLYRLLLHTPRHDTNLVLQATSSCSITEIKDFH